METYIISFKNGNNGLVANDVFQAICSEFTSGKVDDNGIFWIDTTSIKNHGETIEIKDPTQEQEISKFVIKTIQTYYEEYEPVVINGTDFQETTDTFAEAREFHSFLKNRILQESAK